MANTIAKTKTARIPTKSGSEYSYQYTDLASINKWLDENKLDYYQEIETRDDGTDYILTWRYINGEWEDKPKRGCKVVDATLLGVTNPAQQNGSALSYARRYSLCLAFGLACEDDDASNLSKPKEITKEEAENYTFQSGKHAGWTLKRVVEEDEGFLEWLMNNGNEEMLEMINILTGKKPKTDEEWDEQLDLTQRYQRALVDSGVDEEKIRGHFKVQSIKDLTKEQQEEAIVMMNKVIEINKK